MVVALPINPNNPKLPRDIIGIILNYTKEPGDIIAWMRVSKATKAIAEPLLPTRVTFPDHYKEVKALAVTANTIQPRACYRARCFAMTRLYRIFGGKAAFLALPVLDTSNLGNEPSILFANLTKEVMRGSLAGRQFIGVVSKPYWLEDLQTIPQLRRQILIESNNRNGQWISIGDPPCHSIGGPSSDPLSDESTAKLKKLIQTGIEPSTDRDGPIYILSKPEIIRARPQPPSFYDNFNSIFS